MNFVVAIDGTAASGKGTITRALAQQLGLTVLPTGDIYRCLGLEVLRKGYGINQIQEIVELAKQLNIQFIEDNEKQIVYLDGEDVSDEIREPAISRLAASVSSIVQVHDQMILLQRRMAEGKNIIAEGRNLGTEVFPDADVKLYIDADEETRAMRRYKEYVSKGINITYEKVLSDLKWRDNNDKNKEVGALKIAEDATYIDTTEMTTEDVIIRIKDEIQNKMKEKREQEDLKANNDYDFA